jgi:hypothetical protein
LFAVSCKKEKQKYDNRSFYLGMTPWPPDFTSKGYDLAYSFINTNCDMISHHFDDGIPWEESYLNLQMPQKLMDDLARRKEKTGADKKILLSVAPLKISRKERAGAYSGSANTAAWANKPFGDTTVVNAYVNFINYLMNELHPDVINYGVESNSGEWNAADFEEYKKFLSQVHSKLTALHPGKPFFLSFMVTPDVKFLNNAKALEPYTDYITLSAYPYTYIGSPVYGSSSPALIPKGLFQSYFDINTSKPCAFAETGFIAEDLSITGINKEGNEQWQKEYVDQIFDLCENNHAKFIIWFCPYDYSDAVNTFNAIGYTNDLAKLWEHTGLVNAGLIERPACKIWKDWLKLPVQ